MDIHLQLFVIMKLVAFNPLTPTVAIWVQLLASCARPG